MESSLVTVYGRSGCHLCEDAIQILKSWEKPLNFTIEEISIEGDRELEALYGEMIPVVKVDGKYFSHFRVDIEELKSFLEKHRQHR